MPKGKSLQDALAERRPAPPAEETTERQAATPLPVRSARPDRAEKSNITAYFPREVKFELQTLAIERSKTLGRRVTIHDLLGEALNDLFAKHGKPELISLKDNA